MRYILGFLATIGLIIIILILLLRGGGGDSVTAPKKLNLSEYANSSTTAELIMDGPVVANEDHQEIKIQVSSSQVTFSVFSGYQGDLIKQTTYANNISAYTVFIRSLETQGFANGNSDKKLRDERGVCPLGQRRIYSFEDNSQELMRFWSTSCGTKTFNGRIDNVSALFRNQVPDYSKVAAGTQFSY